MQLKKTVREETKNKSAPISKLLMEETPAEEQVIISKFPIRKTGIKGPVSSPEQNSVKQPI